MARDSRRAVRASSTGIGRSLLALAVLMLVGMGFTLMSASAFSGSPHVEAVAPSQAGVARDTP